jgi:hypothetical protein
MNCGQTAKLSTSSSVTTVKNGPLVSRWHPAGIRQEPESVQGDRVVALLPIPGDLLEQRDQFVASSVFGLEHITYDKHLTPSFRVDRPLDGQIAFVWFGYGRVPPCKA